jgi:CHAT domain-containing protein
VRDRRNGNGSVLVGAKSLLCALFFVASTARALPDADSGVAACKEQLRRTPRSFAPYQCLATEVGRGNGAEVRKVLQAVLKRTPDEPRALFYYALVRSLAGEPVEEEEYIRAAEGFRREHDVTGVVYALTTEVAQRCFAKTQCDATTEALLREAEGLAEQRDDVQLKRLCQLWWAREALMVDDVGREERALARLDALPGEDPPWLASQVFETRAHLAGHLHDYQRQYALYAGLLEKNEPGSWQSMVVLGGMGGAASELAARGAFDRARAEQLLRQALAAEERLGFWLSSSDSGALATRVRLALLLGPTDEAMELLRAALAGQLSRKGWSYAYHSRWLLARYTIERNPADTAEALAYADAAVSRATEQSASWEHSRGLLMRAYVQWHGTQPAAARQTALSALDEMEGLRRRQPDLRVRMRYEETLAFAYELVASSLLEHNGVDGTGVADALSVMERLRARGLLETLLQNQGNAESERLTLARSRIDRAQRMLVTPSANRADRMSALGELHAAEAEEVALSTAKGQGASGDRSVPSLTDIQQALGPTEALVSFQQWHREPSLDAPYDTASSWAVVVTRAGAHAARIPDAEELDPQINLWLALLRRRDGSERPGGARLYAQLLEPVVAVLPTAVRHLLIIPDGSLNRVPFDALTDAKGRYVSERFGVSLIPSAAIWLELKRRHLAQPGLALAMAEPAAAPAAESLVRAALGMGEVSLPPLGRARQEAESAVAAFPRGSVLLVGATATEQYLKDSDLRPFSLIHFATHAVVDAVTPERSAIVLAPSPERQDGLLQVEEISRLNLEQKVVVLAACSSSSGPVRRAEGVMSLARAFFEAGAQTVVGTLAPVRDQESAALFEAFYQRMHEGMPVRQALLEAKRERIRAGVPPAAWATVVVLGNDEATPRAAEPASKWPVASAGLGLSLLVGTAVLARLRKRSPQKTA